MRDLFEKLMEHDGVIEVGFTGPGLLGPLREYGYRGPYAGVDLANVTDDEGEYKENFFPFSWTNGLEKENIKNVIDMTGAKKVAYTTYGTLYYLMNPGSQRNAGTKGVPEEIGPEEYIRFLAGRLDGLPIDSQYHLEHILRKFDDEIMYTINGITKRMASVFMDELDDLGWAAEVRRLDEPLRDSSDYLISAER